IGADHAGFQLKEALIKGVLAPYEVLDLGTHSPHQPVDYPEYAFAVAEAVAEERAEYGILVCGTGIGMAMAAARIPGIRAATCTNVFMARMARAHNNANVLCLGGRVLGIGLAEEIVRVFLTTPFEGGRHARRLALIFGGPQRRG
ncbi:MAG TPA: ribose 5-phosphate isomerase B, partial [Candidatus Acetothermia bacterium]|nr:ribose 5-phosphate isomerase B [Candidatus Acetothermia bacterium]